MLGQKLFFSCEVVPWQQNKIANRCELTPSQAIKLASSFLWTSPITSIDMLSLTMNFSNYSQVNMLRSKLTNR